jgi:DNA-binding NtrC family response regulator
MWEAIASRNTSRTTPHRVEDCSDVSSPRADRAGEPMGQTPRLSSSRSSISKPSFACQKASRLLLLVDDEMVRPEMVLRAFAAPEFSVRIARVSSEGLLKISIDSPDVILLDMCFPNEIALKIYQEIRLAFPQTPVVFLIAGSNSDAAIRAMKEGAFDYLFKPLDYGELIRVVREALDVSERTSAPTLRTEVAPRREVEGAIIGKSRAIQEVYKAIARVAEQDFPVLITGESGTGKELVAHAIHRHSARVAAPFRAINCAAIPDQLLESELFGHEKGAFTGADRQRIGKFEQCHRGTLFLDEIGDMPAASQAKILRLTQNQSFERVGGNETICTDVRLIAATHRDLKSQSSTGIFRHDLFYRLGGISIHLPPLRERSDDLPILVQHYLHRFNSMLDRSVHEVSAEAMQMLYDYSWPGNIRELQSVLKQALLNARGDVLLPRFLPDLLGSNNIKPTPSLPTAPPVLNVDSFVRERLSLQSTAVYAETHAYLDRFLLKHVMEHAGGNQHSAARQLGIARQTLRLKFRELGLQVKPLIEDRNAQGS